MKLFSYIDDFGRWTYHLFDSIPNDFQLLVWLSAWIVFLGILSWFLSRMLSHGGGPY